MAPSDPDDVIERGVWAQRLGGAGGDGASHVRGEVISRATNVLDPREIVRVTRSLIGIGRVDDTDGNIILDVPIMPGNVAYRPTSQGKTPASRP